VRTAKLRSLAKINLDLRVLNKRPDGFHELRTVFQTISLADTISIEFAPSKRREVTIDDPAAIPDNLVARAAHAILDDLKLAARVHFRLEKNIPMGGGLGGGSSNAAAVLLALPALAGREVSIERLTSMGHELGSDVPFFLTGGTAIGVGRGTEFYPLPDLAEEPILVVSPGIHSATGPAYAALDRSLTFTGSSRSINSFQAYLRAIGVARRAGPASALSGNDFEAVVFRQHPQLPAILKRLLKAGAVGARMSGSGSSIFAIFESGANRAHARKMLDGDRAFKGCRVLDARLKSRRSYQRMWQRQLDGITG
jgi:4-diphosphocytidyl-2-C-methyl-D-erythritol kinase